MKPEPLTPSDLDLRDFEWMPLQVVRLRDSGIVVVASAEAFRAAVLLWCASWHQVPAASLPKDEKMLCSLAGFGRDLKTWRGLASEALHGFVECSDGRLYHPVIAEKAIESGSKKKKQGRQTAAATEAARLARLARDAERNGVRDDDRNGLQGIGEDRNGEDKTKTESEKRGESNPPSVLKLVDEGNPIPIDESYVPSDPAIEYAFSLGMKKAELDSELRKFVMKSISLRVVSFNIDMNFKLWCDRWLQFKLKDNPDWKPAPAVEEKPREPMLLVIQGTPEGVAWDHNQRSRNLRPLFYSKHIVDGVEVIAAQCKTLWPEGYDEATGERIAPTNEEDAA
jgi:hypothetical protein